MKKTAMFLVVLAGIFWGTSAIFSNVLRPFGYNALQMTAMRAIIGAVFMAVYILIKEPKAFKIKFNQLYLYFLGGMGLFFTAFFYYESMSQGSVAVAVMLMYTSPILVTVYSVYFLKEKMSISKALCIVFMIVGCALVSGIISGANSTVWGICSGLLASLFYGSYSIVTKIQMNRRYNPSSATLYCFVFMALIAVILSDVPEIIHIASSSPVKIYPLIIGIGVCTEAIPYFLYTISLKYIPAGVASSLGIVEPVMATVFAAIFFEGMPDIFTILGIITVAVSVVILSKLETTERKYVK